MLVKSTGTSIKSKALIVFEQQDLEINIRL